MQFCIQGGVVGLLDTEEDQFVCLITLPYSPRSTIAALHSIPNISGQHSRNLEVQDSSINIGQRGLPKWGVGHLGSGSGDGVFVMVSIDDASSIRTHLEPGAGFDQAAFDTQRRNSEDQGMVDWLSYA